VENFDANDILAELEDLLRYYKHNQFNKDIITDINVKTLALYASYYYSLINLKLGIFLYSS